MNDKAKKHSVINVWLINNWHNSRIQEITSNAGSVGNVYITVSYTQLAQDMLKNIIQKNDKSASYF